MFDAVSDGKTAYARYIFSYRSTLPEAAGSRRRCVVVRNEQSRSATNIKHVDKVHADAMVIDAHADIEVPGKESPYVGPDGRSKVAPDKMARGGVDGVVLSVATGPGPRTTEGYAKARRIADRKLAAAASTDCGSSQQSRTGAYRDRCRRSKGARQTLDILELSEYADHRHGPHRPG